jgi:hypothetical protein
MGGLAFSYMARARPPNELFELDIFLIASDLYFDGYLLKPFRISKPTKTLSVP